MRRIQIQPLWLLATLLLLLVGGAQGLLLREARSSQTQVAELNLQCSALNYANEQQTLRVAGLKEAQTVLSGVRYRPFENAVGLYSFLDELIKVHGLERGNVIPVPASPGRFSVQVEVTGDYYGLVKTLGALRQEERALRVEALNVDALSGDRVKGTLTLGTLMKEVPAP